jgi:hypothetical protein
VFDRVQTFDIPCTNADTGLDSNGMINDYSSV